MTVRSYGYPGTFQYKLNDKIVFPRFNASGNIETLARSIVSTYKDDIPLLQLGTANVPPLGTDTTKEDTGHGMATVLYELLQTQELSFRCVYDYQENTMSFIVWQGLDRTQDQSVNKLRDLLRRLPQYAERGGHHRRIEL